MTDHETDTSPGINAWATHLFEMYNDRLERPSPNVAVFSQKSLNELTAFFNTVPLEFRWSVFQTFLGQLHEAGLPYDESSFEGDSQETVH